MLHQDLRLLKLTDYTTYAICLVFFGLFWPIYIERVYILVSSDPLKHHNALGLWLTHSHFSFEKFFLILSDSMPELFIRLGVSRSKFLISI